MCRSSISKSSECSLLVFLSQEKGLLNKIGKERFMFHKIATVAAALTLMFATCSIFAAESEGASSTRNATTSGSTDHSSGTSAGTSDTTHGGMRSTNPDTHIGTSSGLKGTTGSGDHSTSTNIGTSPGLRGTTGTGSDSGSTPSTSTGPTSGFSSRSGSSGSSQSTINGSYNTNNPVDNSGPRSNTGFSNSNAGIYGSDEGK